MYITTLTGKHQKTALSSHLSIKLIIFAFFLRFDEIRWLHPESLTPKQKLYFCPFGAGTRVYIRIHLAKMKLQLGTAVLLKKCWTLKLADRTTEDSMKIWNFILAGPIARRCEVTFEKKGPG